MKRIQTVILDDQPIRSGLPKLNQLSFINNTDLKWQTAEDLAATGDKESNGVLMRSINPLELTSSDPSEWENTIFLVDVNWHEIPPDTPGFEGMSEENKQSYGVEIAEEIFAIREQFDSNSIHVIFFSNSRADLVDQEVRRWQREGIQNVHALFLGAGQYTSSKLVEDYLVAYRSVVSNILKRADPVCVKAVHDAVESTARKLTQEPGLGLDLNSFLGESMKLDVNGYRLVDLAFPFLNSPLRESNLFKLQAWRDLFDADYLQISPIVISQADSRERENAEFKKQPSEAALVLQSILRYGLRGKLNTSSQRLAPSGTEGICFADLYLFGAGILRETQLTDPSLALKTWAFKGLGTSSQNPNDWNFFYPLNSCLSNDLGGQLSGSSSKNVPNLFKDSKIWSVERSGWNPEASIKLRKFNQRPAISWTLELDESKRIECPHLRAQFIADAFRSGKEKSLQVVWDSWVSDQDHFELLEVLADNLEDVPKLKISQSDLTRLGERFALAVGLLETAIANIEKAGRILSKVIGDSPAHPGRLLKLSKQLLDHAVPRLKGWKELQAIFSKSAQRCGVSKQSFSDMYGEDFELD